ncbi:WG repeat-containing protein [Haloplasma contractile]|uniref:KWG leptospira repeat protein n=1 Tax=Haloplasma contractile SSD-17B TaxID=1033810 RepID=F7PRG7_9MOLU|nr:WG repeat-containing protein [Haloplasma contractile]ERJ11707.1 KWG leptospira repeat protein [Haloplasma contractile SSD-17B]
MEKDEFLKHLIKGYLPEGATLLVMDQPYDYKMIGSGSLDEDDVKEVVAAYEFNNHCYILILKYTDQKWNVIETIDMGEYEVSYLKVASVTSKTKSSIILGLKLNNNCSKLQIIDYTKNNTFKKLINQDIIYNEIDVYDMEGEKSTDGKVEIALWKKDEKEAYDVNIYRWSKTQLTYAIDVYKSYFKTVMKYYRDLVDREPDESIYWFYLALAYLKLDQKDHAIKSIDKALMLENPYPSESYLKSLKDMTTRRGMNRALKLYPASKRTTSGTKWGYINQDGKFVIKPIYQNTKEFDKFTGLAVVKEDSYLGLIDRFGNYVIKPKFLEINGFSEGLAIVVDEEGFKVTDETGTIITNQVYDFIGNYSEKRAVFRITSDEGEALYGYLDEQGNEVIEASYLDANDFYEERAVVKIEDNQFGLITPKNQVIERYDYNYVGPYASEDKLIFKKDKSKKYGYISTAGAIVLPATYSDANPFKDSRAIVNMSSKKNKYGVINSKGDFVIKPEYFELKNLGEGRFAVGKAIDDDQPYRGTRYAIADQDGNFLTNFTYYNVSDYKDWIATAYDVRDTFFINMSGGVMSALPIVVGSGTLDYLNQLIKAEVDYRTSYLTPRDDIIYEQNKEVPLSKRKTFVVEEKYRPNMDYLVYYPQIKGLPNHLTEQIVNERLEEESKADEAVPSDMLLNYTLYGDFEIIFNHKQLVTIVITTYKYEFGSAHGVTEQFYAHIDLKTGRFYKLGDLFKKNSDYKGKIETMIKEQVEETEQYDYVFEDADFFIKDDQIFALDQNTLTIYYKPYEIAPYVAGFPSFTVPFSDIDSIINKKGEFYKSFN